MLSFLPLDVLDEIWDVIESVSEGFLTYCSVDLKVIRTKTSGICFILPFFYEYTYGSSIIAGTASV